MTRALKWVLSGMLVLGFAAPMLAAEKTTKPAAKPEKIALSGKWQQMANALDLSVEQQKQLAEKVKAMNEGLKQFEETNAAKIKAAKEQADALATERKAVTEKLNAEVMAFFTPEQVQKVAAVEMVQRAAGKYKLTAEQQAKAMELATAAAKALADIKADDKQGGAKKAEITRKFEADVQALITPEQKQALEADVVLREAKRGVKIPSKLTPESEKAIEEAAIEAAKKIAELEAQKAQVVAGLKAKVEAEAAKAPAPAPKKAPEKKADKPAANPTN